MTSSFFTLNIITPVTLSAPKHSVFKYTRWKSKVMFAMERCSKVFLCIRCPYHLNHSDLSASTVQFVRLLLIHTHRTDVHVGGHEEEGRGEENKGVFSRSFRIKERREAIVASRNSLRQSPAQTESVRK